ncbi:hypothetical protein [Pseudoalteromonas sp. GB56]
MTVRVNEHEVSLLKAARNSLFLLNKYLITLSGRTVVELHNPLLPEKTPLETSQYWLTYEELIQREKSRDVK